MSELFKTMQISGAGMRTQGTRLRVISQNLANVNSLATEPGGKPYQRKVVTFKNQLDRALGVEKVTVADIRPDTSDFGKKFDPGHPAADADGYVLTPNVNSIIEMSDMREAQRTYEANLNVIRSSKSMISQTIDILR